MGNVGFVRDGRQPTVVGQAALPVSVAKRQASCLSYDRCVPCFTPGLQESVWLLAHCPSEPWIRSVAEAPHSLLVAGQER